MGARETMDRSAIRLATKLLLKAESTDSDHESVALALRSYSLLAGTINAFEDDPTSGARRHERRLLQDRRAASRAADPGRDDGAAGSGHPARGSTARQAAAYRRFVEAQHAGGLLDCAL